MKAYLYDAYGWELMGLRTSTSPILFKILSKKNLFLFQKFKLDGKGWNMNPPILTYKDESM